MARERKIIGGSEDDNDDEGFNENPIDSTSNSASGVGSTLGAVAPSETDVALRPKRMADMVGQQDVMDVIHIAIDAAKKRKEPPLPLIHISRRRRIERRRSWGVP